jgi:hypothetical protein
MKSIWKSKNFALALVLAASTGLILADDAKAPTPDAVAKAMAEAGTPGAAHAKLKPLAGSWTYTGKCWMDPNKPPVELTGSIERRWILGGRFLEERVSGTGFDGQPGGFEGLGLLGYDNTQQKYTSSFACNLGTGTSTGIGVSDGPGRFTFQSTCYCPLSKAPVQGRDVLRIESNDRLVLEYYKTVDGKEVKAMEFVEVRKK